MSVMCLWVEWCVEGLWPAPSLGTGEKVRHPIKGYVLNPAQSAMCTSKELLNLIIISP